MPEGPNRAPGRYEVPVSNGAPVCPVRSATQGRKRVTDNRPMKAISYFTSDRDRHGWYGSRPKVEMPEKTESACFSALLLSSATRDCWVELHYLRAAVAGQPVVPQRLVRPRRRLLVVVTVVGRRNGRPREQGDALGHHGGEGGNSRAFLLRRGNCLDWSELPCEGRTDCESFSLSSGHELIYMMRRPQLLRERSLGIGRRKLAILAAPGAQTVPSLSGTNALQLSTNGEDVAEANAASHMPAAQRGNRVCRPCH